MFWQLEEIEKPKIKENFSSPKMELPVKFDSHLTWKSKHPTFFNERFLKKIQFLMELLANKNPYFVNNNKTFQIYHNYHTDAFLYGNTVLLRNKQKTKFVKYYTIFNSYPLQKHNDDLYVFLIDSYINKNCDDIHYKTNMGKIKKISVCDTEIRFIGLNSSYIYNFKDSTFKEEFVNCTRTFHFKFINHLR